MQTKITTWPRCSNHSNSLSSLAEFMILESSENIMTVDTPRSRPNSKVWRTWSSFEKQLEKNLQANQDSFDFHPSCLCPDCLEARQDNTRFPVEIEDTALELEVTSHQLDDIEKELYNSSMLNADIEPVKNESVKNREGSCRSYLFAELLMSSDDDGDDDEYEYEYGFEWKSEDVLVPIGEDPRSVEVLHEVPNQAVTASPSFNKFIILERQ